VGPTLEPRTNEISNDCPKEIRLRHWITWLDSLPQCKPKDSPEFITWLESLPQRKPKDHPDYINWLDSLPQCKPEGHPDSVEEWELSLSGIPFDEGMKDLKEYKEMFRDCNVSHCQEGYESLYSWVNNIWQVKKQKRHMNLTDNMIVSLNDIGFEWNLTNFFNDWFDELKEYKEMFRDCKVSSRNKEYKSLARWVANMRNARKGKHSMKLTGEMIVILNDIGFFWGKVQSAELSDAEKVKFGMEPAPKKDDTSMVRKRAKADASVTGAPKKPAELREERKQRRQKNTNDGQWNGAAA